MQYVASPGRQRTFQTKAGNEQGICLQFSFQSFDEIDVGIPFVFFLIERIAGVQISYSQQACFPFFLSEDHDVVASEYGLPVVGRQRQTADKMECIVPVCSFISGFTVEEQTAVNRNFLFCHSLQFNRQRADIQSHNLRFLVCYGGIIHNDLFFGFRHLAKIVHVSGDCLFTVCGGIAYIAYGTKVATLAFGMGYQFLCFL